MLETSAACAPPAVTASIDVLGRTRAAAGDDGDVDTLGDGGGQGNVVAGLRPVGVHRSQHDLARAPVFHHPHPIESVKAGGSAPAVDVDFPAGRVFARLFRVNRDDHALRAELFRAFRDQVPGC